MTNTSKQYDASIAICRDIFAKKLRDYGTSWRMFRISSITDQVFIKAQRIRTIEQNGNQKVADDIRGEYIGMVNYSIIALIQMELKDDKRMELPVEETQQLYAKYAAAAKSLMEDKNHDYGEAWRDMRLSSLTDLILVKLLRIKQIEDNEGTTVISEGIDANYFDIINYAIFALIRLSEGH
ncbi:MAG: DUF1599 domain-containing protein [Bacteroidota bacterium]|nr:DUF1599 domain-containing protein [Bacteroidota bacterium]